MLPSPPFLYVLSHSAQYKIDTDAPTRSAVGQSLLCMASILFSLSSTRCTSETMDFNANNNDSNEMHHTLEKACQRIITQLTIVYVKIITLC